MGTPSDFGNGQFSREWPSELPHLVSASAIQVFASRIPNWNDVLVALLAFGPPTCRFPDGSIYFEHERAINDLRALITTIYSSDQSLAFTQFRSLAPFSRKIYTLVYTDDLVQKLGGLMHFRVCPAILSADGTLAHSPGEYDLQGITLTIVFRRTPSRKVIEEFAKAVATWAQSVSTEGLFGEGPIRVVSDSIEFHGTRAQFVIDASLTGQHTLNWFVLTMLCFAYDVALLLGVQFDCTEYTDKYWGPAKGKRAIINISDPMRTAMGSTALSAIFS